MLKITGSRFNVYDADNIKAVTYLDCVDGIINNVEVDKLENFKHHHFTTRFQHSLNVSYYSYCICRYFGWDYRSAARAGLMHDLYFFENTSTDENGNKLLKNHPFDALENSEKIFDLNDIEKDAIVNHMWPCTSMGRPKYKESMAVSLSDKYCAVMEAVVGSCSFMAKKAANAADSTAAGAKFVGHRFRLILNFIA
ncbi:MAG: hydrolase [Clostridiales bacterium]|nr:hydrolase [Clostridiales bacterium]